MNTELFGCSAQARRPNCGERQEIARTSAGGELRLDHRCQKRFRARSILELVDDLAMRPHRGPLDPLVLLAEPALPRQKGWDRLVLELRLSVLTEQIRPITRHHQGQEFGRSRLQTGAFLCGEQIEPK